MMINILFTINFLTNGGPTRVLENIISSLDRKKYNITILTLINENNQKLVEKLTKDGIKIVQLNYSKSLGSILKDRKKIEESIKEIKPDIIHTHGIVSSLLFYLMKIDAYKITTIHNNMFEDYKYTYGKYKGIIFSFIHIWTLKGYNNVICCSKTSYEALKRKCKNLSYIRNGIDCNINNVKNKNEIRKELNIPENDTVFTYVGVVNERKRVVELVKMFASTLKNDEWLLIVGDGELLEEAKKYKNDRIIFVGFKENALDYLNASDIYISNSSSEGFSISIIEALHCNLYCFLSDIPSHKECFEIDNEFYIGEYFNDGNFVEQKEKLITNVKNIKCNNNSKFQDKYLSSKAMTKEYEKYYQIYKVGRENR